MQSTAQSCMQSAVSAGGGRSRVRRRFMRCFATRRRRRQLHLPKATTPRAYGFIFDTVAVCLHSPSPQLPLPASSAVCCASACACFSACAYSLCLPAFVGLYISCSFFFGVANGAGAVYIHMHSHVCVCTCVNMFSELRFGNAKCQ